MVSLYETVKQEVSAKNIEIRTDGSKLVVSINLMHLETRDSVVVEFQPDGQIFVRSGKNSANVPLPLFDAYVDLMIAALRVAKSGSVAEIVDKFFDAVRIVVHPTEEENMTCRPEKDNLGW